MRALAQFLIDVYDERGTIDATSIVHEVTDNAMRNLISDLTLSRYELSRKWQHNIAEPDPMVIARGSIRIIQNKAVQSEREKVQQAIKKGQMHQENVRDLQKRDFELTQLLNQLNK
jgi:hypothetical protein